MHQLETLMVLSVENLLTRREADVVVDRMRAHIADAPVDAFESARREKSIHGIPGLSPGETSAVYEPNGRLEVDVVPGEVATLVNGAIERQMDDIRRLVPSVTGIDDWVYVEYRRGEYVSPHVDYAENADRPERPKVVGIGIQLNDDLTGGEFFIETTASAQLWHDTVHGIDIAPVANNHSEWFRQLPRTRWITRAAKGSALLYGTRVVHGTCPVESGVSRKLIGWLLA
jgi:hypothetical protein